MADSKRTKSDSSDINPTGLQEVQRGSESHQPNKQNPLQSYKMDASHCGLCLIINNVKFLPESYLRSRNGSNIDCDKLEKRFKSLNFIVDVQQDLTHEQIIQQLSALSKKDHTKYDCCIVVILSHGSKATKNLIPGAVHGVDGPTVPVEDITSFLNGEHCPSLQGKPKIFFIQACGGDEKDKGREVPIQESSDRYSRDAVPVSGSDTLTDKPDKFSVHTTLPVPSDILVSYSTYPGYVSWRDKETGTWYVETLDQILAENAASNDLVTMLTMVNNKVAQNSVKDISTTYKQMPFFLSSLRKNLYFQCSPKGDS
ncbi:caspase-9-like isoform X1 [Paramormyrops kingsleyae]|uniref:caspase-9-like isoform X1 n=1 Tax=Paramormyrops kingsleyae TaxID=1676925 RepID=UPI000CD645EB|nr:caspase-9-like isoform X1 [Paramormyrops kingsleyae]